MLGLYHRLFFFLKELSVCWYHFFISNSVLFPFHLICRSISPPTVFTKVSKLPHGRKPKRTFQFSSYLKLSTAFSSVNHSNIFPLWPPWQDSLFIFLLTFWKLFFRQFYRTSIFSAVIRYYKLKFLGVPSSFSSIYPHPTTFIISCHLNADDFWIDISSS